MLARMLHDLPFGGEICSIEGCQHDDSGKLFLSSGYDMLIHKKRN